MNELIKCSYNGSSAVKNLSFAPSNIDLCTIRSQYFIFLGEGVKGVLDEDPDPCRRFNYLMLYNLVIKIGCFERRAGVIDLLNDE